MTGKWRGRAKPLTASLLLLSGLTILNGCADPTPPVEVSIKGCKAFDKITWSTRDSRKTIDGVRRHNKTYGELCE